MARLPRLLEALPCAVAVVARADGRVLAANAAWRRLAPGNIAAGAVAVLAPLLALPAGGRQRTDADGAAWDFEIAPHPDDPALALVTRTPAPSDQAHLLVRAFADRANDMFALSDAETARFVYVNATEARALGYGPDEIVGRLGVPDMVPGWTLEAFHALVARLEAGETVPPFDSAILRRDGTPLPVEVSVTLVHHGTARYIGAVCRDITERRAAEAAMRDSEARFRTLAEALPHLVWTADAEGQIDWRSPRWAAFTGRPATPPPNWHPPFHPDDDARVVAAWQHSVATGEPFEVEHRICRHDGEWRWFLTRALPLRDADGSGPVQRWFGTATDIHDRRATEEALAEKTAVLDAIAANTEDIIFAKQADGRVLFVNDAITRYAGRPAAEIVGTDPATYLFPGEAAAVAAADRRIIASGRPERVDALTFGRLFSVTKAPWYGPDGTLRGLVGVSHDLTERIAAERALADSEQRLGVTFAAAPVGMAIFDRDLRFVMINDRLAEMNGVPVAGHLGRTLRDVVPTVADAAAPLLRRVFETGQAVRDVELRGETAAAPGQMRWWLGSYAPITAPDGRVTGLIAAVLDITERKQAEARLAEREERFRTFAECAPDVIYIVDAPARRIEYLNPAFEAIWGEPRELAMRDFSRLTRHVHPDDRTRLRAAVRRVFLDGEPSFSEYRILRPADGAERHISDTMVPIRDAAGRIARVIGLARDETERRRAEAALVASEERMALASSAARLGIWEVHVRTGTGIVNAEYRALYGLPPGDQPLAHAQWLAMIHPDDRDRMEAVARHTHGAGGNYRAEYRILRADTGELRWLAAHGSVVGRDGPSPRVVGVCFDITERRQEQERQMMLAREVDHRAKNMLAVVMSIMKLTRSTDPKRFAETVEGRVEALARAHTLLSRDRWTGASLRDVVAKELAACSGAGQVALDGPAVRLTARAVQPLSMVLHEMATNALKHGALSRADGRISVSWHLADGPPPGGARLELHWQERGGPCLGGPPTRQGFGSRLIESTVRGQLGGGIARHWDAAGLRCTISIPAAQAVTLLGAADGTTSTSIGADGAPALRGRRVLVVEDEPLVAMETAAVLAELGCDVIGPIGTLAEALGAARGQAGRLDAAVLDINPHGPVSTDVAQTLQERGVPIVCMTGYRDLSPPWRCDTAAVLRKPAEDGRIIAALRRALAEGVGAAG